MSPRNVTLVKRPSQEKSIPDFEWLTYTAEERIAAVWTLTMECLSWQGIHDEPRLQRAVVRILRPRRELKTIGDISVPVLSRVDLIANKRATGRMQDLADVEALEALYDR